MDTLTTTVRDTGRNQRLLTTLEGLLAIQATQTGPALTQASNLVAAALSADKVDVFVYDPGIDTLVALGTSDTPMGCKQKALGLDRLPLSNGGTAARVFETGQPYLTGHLEQDPDELPGIKGELGVRSTLAVALTVDGKRRGAMQVDADRPDLFTEDDLAFLQAVAYWVGMIMHRAELVEHVAHKAAEQARLRTADEMVTILAHDLRTPLVPVRGYLGMIINEARRAGLPPIISGYAERAQCGVDRLMRMTANLLDATRIDHGMFAIIPEVIDLAALARETCEPLDTPANPIELRAAEPLVIEADISRVRQIIENLVSNAQRHSPEGMPIILEAGSEHRENGSWAVLTVQDVGPGIAPDLLPRIFTRFSSGSTGGALGLGLYLARGIAQAHGGTLTVASTPGQGASFRLELPMP